MRDDKWKKNVILFISSQTISLFGSSLVQFAITWYITLETKSGIMMTISIICGFLPTFFLSPFAGVWADRYNRKAIIILADTMTAVSTLILAVLFLSGYNAFWLLFVVSAIRSVGAGIQTPAVGAFLPQLVPENMLTKVNAISGSLQSFTLLLAPMLSGALLTFAAIETIFFIDVVTAAAAILILLLFLHAKVHGKALGKPEVSYFTDLRKGFSYINSHSYIKSFFLFSALFFFLVAPSAFLTPLQVVRSFGEDVWRLTAIEMIFSVGMILGGILMASWGGFKNKVHTMTLSYALIGLCTFSFGVILNFFVYLFFMAIIGLSISVFHTPAAVLLQERVEEDYLGRVFGVMGMISSSMMPLGMLIFGPLADIVKIELLLVSTGLLLVVLGFFLLNNRALITAGKPVLRGELHD